jgi:hypothetical protein
MKKVLFVLLLSPLFSYAQCPQYIGKSIISTRHLVKQAETKLGITFTDSSTERGNNKRLTFESVAGITFQILMADNLVSNISIKGEKEKINALVSWLKTAYAPCITKLGNSYIVTSTEYFGWKTEGAGNESILITSKDL